MIDPLPKGGGLPKIFTKVEIHMKEKKNIDSIFNEGFKNIEATPSPRVWKNIQTQLKKEKKERKVIPLWIKLGGVAALIALLLTVGNALYTTSENSVSPKITDENVKQTEKQLHENSSEIENNASETKIASEEKSVQNSETERVDPSDANSLKKGKESNSSKNLFKNASHKTNTAVIASDNSKTNASEAKENFQENSTEKQRYKNNANEANEGIAISKSNSEATKTDKIAKEANETIIKKKQEIFEQSTNGIANNDTPKKNAAEKNAVKTEAEAIKDSESKKSIFDAIADNTEDKNTEKDKKQNPEYRWKVAPNVAPVYYSSLGNGSSIDPSFADNPQEGDVNMSYGVQVSYALSQRLSVRTGVNNVDLSYSTTGVEVGTGPAAYALRSVDYGGRDLVTTVVDKGSLANASPSNGFGTVSPKSTTGETRLVQNINYYEVPLELKYAVIDSKLGVHIIGGVSTLFLGNNEILVKADNFSSVLGEANNLSAVSFSTNVGLGLDYKLSKKFTFNIEPMFKYQLNPYTDSSVNFKPYYLGIYSGLSFKF